MEQVGIVSDLWRFPVKSFGGERVRRAFVGPFGLVGDRRHAVVDVATGGALTARRTSALLHYGARSTTPDTGEGTVVTLPDGREVDTDDPELARDLSERLGREVLMGRSPTAVHDCAPVHLVSESAIAQVAAWLDGEADRRRFRANVVVELDGDDPFGEAAWPGHALGIGDGVVLQVVNPTERCAVTTFDPDTVERDTRVLASIARERDNLFGVYAAVARGGWVSVGDPVILVRED